ncbi:unnamed protein product [Schistocephalus solidus]|uniref:methylated diphthine methylhydrolase n=1 Tax=Schistocephalus solidus TaxID=70667 RepID=A0A183SHM8_SCHSO|nr:unnamed protein product [Schistocephalus solidus]
MVDLLKQHETAGVLDLSWFDDDVCLVALSTGEIGLVNLVGGFYNLDMSTYPLSSSLLLSIDVLDSRAIVSAADGSLFLFDIEKYCTTASCRAHDFEAWTAALHKTNRSLVLSGGDDCLARLWDVRDGLEKPIFSQRHEMGVCSVSSLPNCEHIISTGCFDERLRIWDLRAPKSPLVKEVVHTTGGGVWRHKWANPSASHVLLAAMHAGFAVGAFEANVLDCSNDIQTAPLVSYYRQTSELAYGVDWFILSEQSGSSNSPRFRALVATCSFYDNHVTFAVYEE